MTTLEQIKNEYAKDQGFKNWDVLFFERQFNEKRMCDDWHNVIELAQKEYLKRASKNVTTVHHENQSLENIKKAVELTQRSIISNENIIK